jgi:hypothetical protein
MAGVILQRCDLESQMIGEIAEVNACVAALPAQRRAALYDLVDADIGRSLDLLETELDLYRRSGGSRHAPLTAQAETH